MNQWINKWIDVGQMNTSLIWIMRGGVWGQDHDMGLGEISGAETSVSETYQMISSLPRTPLAGWGYILLSSCSLFMLDNLFGCYFLLMHRSEVFIEFRRKASLSAVQCPGILSPQSLVERHLQLFPIVTLCEKLALVYLGPSYDQIGKVCLPAITGWALLDGLGGPWLLV